MTPEELQKIAFSYKTDPVIKSLFKQIAVLYNTAIPIGISRDGLIYNEDFNTLIQQLKDSITRYTINNYSKLFVLEKVCDQKCCKCDKMADYYYNGSYLCNDCIDDNL